MEKNYRLPLDQYLLDLIDLPIRTHEDCVRVILNVVKYWQVYEYLDIGEIVGSVSLKVSKMSRIFIEKDNCIYSMQMPFSVRTEEDKSHPVFFSPNVGVITNQLISRILSLMELNLVSEDCISSLADEVLTLSETNPGIWSFYWSLMSFESGYLRYDYDSVNENGLIHPLNHFDIFFSSNSTFKLGLDSRTELSTFSDILDRETNCHFLFSK